MWMIWANVVLMTLNLCSHCMEPFFSKTEIDSWQNKSSILYNLKTWLQIPAFLPFIFWVKVHVKCCPVHHVTYAPAKFEVARSKCFALTRKYIIGEVCWQPVVTRLFGLLTTGCHQQNVCWQPVVTSKMSGDNRFSPAKSLLTTSCIFFQ